MKVVEKNPLLFIRPNPFHPFNRFTNCFDRPERRVGDSMRRTDSGGG
jgi:hypothetical protein